MDKKIGIVICNYNKQEYIINCIQSVLDSSIWNFDVYVVDNASTDDSVKCIKEQFGDRITLLVNQENLGGSGGFNTGLREALKQDYKYIMLMDNDIVADKKAIEELYLFMEEHEAVGMVGSKVYFMDYPEQIWGYGGHIDWKQYKQKDQYKNCVDSDAIPEISYCDYVAACSLMARTDAIRTVGLMPEDNFIYWDDMEWGYRFNEAGYKVAVYGKSKIWHKAGGRNAGNTFIHYYMWRNRMRFFLKVLPEEKRGHFAETLLTEMFRMIYSVNLKGETSIVKTLMYAFDDAAHGISGKAAEYKILPRPEVKNRVAMALEGARTVLIRFNGDWEGLGNIVRYIQEKNNEKHISISIHDIIEKKLIHGKNIREELQKQYPKCTITEEYIPKKYDAHLVMCPHIFKLNKSMKEDWYIDAWCNIIFNKEDFIYASSFEQSKELFLLCKQDILLNSN